MYDMFFKQLMENARVSSITYPDDNAGIFLQIQVDLNTAPVPEVNAHLVALSDDNWDVTSGNFYAETASFTMRRQGEPAGSETTPAE